MAGIKRKVDASRGSSALPSQDNSTGESLSRRGRGRGRGRPAIRGTRGGRGRGASSAASTVGSAVIAASIRSEVAAEEEILRAEGSSEPRPKRRKILEKQESPQTTRQSARIKAGANSASTELISVSSRQDSLDPSSSDTTINGKKAAPQLAKAVAQITKTKTDIPALPLSSPPQLTDLLPAESSDDKTALKSINSFGIVENATSPEKDVESKDATGANVTRSRKRLAGPLDPAELKKSANLRKRVKVEDEDVNATLQKPLLNGDGHVQGNVTPGSASQPTGTVEKLTVAAPRASENIETPPNYNSAPPSNPRGRGRGRGGRGRGGRGRGRGAARGGGPTRGGRGRGRGGRGGGRGGKRGEDESDVELERSPSPSPAMYKVQERQRELKQSFKRLAGAQRLALNVLGSLSQQRLVRDKTAHRKAPEHEDVQNELRDALARRQEILRQEYKHRVAQANRLFEAQKELLKQQFRASAQHVQEEHFHAAQGEYMACVEGVQQAEDDEHTEPDLDRPEPAEVSRSDRSSVSSVYDPLYLDEPRFERGYNSSFIRVPSAAAAYKRGKKGWDEFDQRARMKDISQEEVLPPGQDFLLALLQAAELESETVLVKSVEAPPMGLLTLAEAAMSSPHPAPQRPILPQPQLVPGHPELPSFFLPRPPMPRPILPTSHGLPDPFTTGGGPPQLPPPHGVTFGRPGMHGFLPPMQHHQHGPGYYFPPPPPPPHGSPPNRSRPY